MTITLSSQMPTRYFSTMYEFDFSRLINHDFRGEHHVHAKLNELAVKDIRVRYSSGQATQTQLAHEYRVSQVTIHRIVHGKMWKSGGSNED